MPVERTSIGRWRSTPQAQPGQARLCRSTSASPVAKPPAAKAAARLVASVVAPHPPLMWSPATQHLRRTSSFGFLDLIGFLAALALPEGLDRAEISHASTAVGSASAVVAMQPSAWPPPAAACPLPRAGRHLVEQIHEMLRHAHR
ncbi:MAG: hypothetical protein U1E17_03020 [Geminicoccaceae bacterium]